MNKNVSEANWVISYAIVRSGVVLKDKITSLPRARMIRSQMISSGCTGKLYISEVRWLEDNPELL